MVIEFIGAPGAGKTTLIPTVADVCRTRGICARTVVDAARPSAQRTWAGQAVARFAPQTWRRPLLWQVFYHLSAWSRFAFCARHPRLIGSVLTTQLRRPIPAETRRHAWHWFIHLTGYYQFLLAQARDDEALILDEGFTHRVVQMYASHLETPDSDRIAAYVDLIPRPDLVIAVHAPWEVCLERIYQRGLWERFQRYSPDEVAAFVRNAHRIVNLTIDYIRGAGWTLLEVDNGGGDPVLAQQRLRAGLETLMPALTPHPVGAGVYRNLAV